MLLDELREASSNVVRRRRRLVVLEVEVVQQLGRGGKPVAAPGDGLDHARHSAGHERVATQISSRATGSPSPSKRSRRRSGRRPLVARRSRAWPRPRSQPHAATAPSPRARDGTRLLRRASAPGTPHADHAESLARDPFLGRDAQRRQVAVGHEDQSTFRSQQPGCFRQPQLRVTPRGDSVLTDHEVVTSAGQGHPLSVPLDQREHRTDLGLHPARGHQLLVRDVDGHRPGAGPGQPRGEVGGTAGQFHDVETVDLPRTPSSRSGIAKSPHTVSGRDHSSSAAASVNRSFTTAQRARFSALSEPLTSAIRSCYVCGAAPRLRWPTRRGPACVPVGEVSGRVSCGCEVPARL